LDTSPPNRPAAEHSAANRPSAEQPAARPSSVAHETTRVAVVGATGYTGAELLRLLYQHPHVDIVRICGHSTVGQPLGAVLTSFAGVDLPDVTAFDSAELGRVAEVVFLCVPHGTAQDAAADCLAAGLKVIDLSADHRFDDPAVYARIYAPHARPESLAQTVYALPELKAPDARQRERIAASRLVGCPGCYPTSVILAAAPAVHAGLLAPDADIIADCKSGVSGAGRKANLGSHFSETSEGLRAYKTLAHRHAPEIARALGVDRVHFVPHLVPMNRGILATVYLRLASTVDLAQARAVYDDYYADGPFVTVLPAGAHPDTRHVRGTNRAHLGLFVDGDLLVVQAVIDNLTKGSSGQAVQAFNLMQNLPETCGLTLTAMFP
jgi:N-acetyl-gamma-glutamyl-phosphate reductase